MPIKVIGLHGGVFHPGANGELRRPTGRVCPVDGASQEVRGVGVPPGGAVAHRVDGRGLKAGGVGKWVCIPFARSSNSVRLHLQLFVGTFLAGLAVLPWGAVSDDTSGYWQQEVHYLVHARLDESTATLSARETITYINRSPDTLAGVLPASLPECLSTGVAVG